MTFMASSGDYGIATPTLHAACKEKERELDGFERQFQLGIWSPRSLGV